MKAPPNAGAVPAYGAVIPDPETPEGAAKAQQQLRIAQWMTPVVTAALVAAGDDGR